MVECQYGLGLLAGLDHDAVVRIRSGQAHVAFELHVTRHPLPVSPAAISILPGVFDRADPGTQEVRVDPNDQVSIVEAVVRYGTYPKGRLVRIQ